MIARLHVAALLALSLVCLTACPPGREPRNACARSAEVAMRTP